MSRFQGFQNDEGVAVLDRLTGELVFHPFDGSSPSVLRPASLDVEVGQPPRATARGTTAPPSSEQDDRVVLRPERRLNRPRPMVIQQPGAEEAAALKAARLKAVASSRPDAKPDGGDNS